MNVKMCWFDPGGSGYSKAAFDSASLQFLLIFRKAAAGELAQDSGLDILARLSEIDVSAEGVKGAKTFFDAKVSVLIWIYGIYTKF